MDDRVWWVWLQHGLGPGASKQRRIFETYRSIEDFYRAGTESWQLDGYFTQRELLRLQSFPIEKAQAQLEYTLKLGQRIITPEMGAYPQCLREIRNYPCVLYVKGTLPPVDFLLSIAMVGTRKATRSGCTAAHTMAYTLAKAGAVIISGGALGIDTQSHRGAVEAGGRSICVLGCGIDSDYLLSNASLRQAVAVDGALVSEYPPGTPAMSSNFPIRNRIISGLCDATVVVEAAGKSGSLITAGYAVDQGRDVFAVPGSVQNPKAKGTNELIRDGCAPATSALDILRCYVDKYRVILPDDPGVNVTVNEEMNETPEPKTHKSLPPETSTAAGCLYQALTSAPAPIDELCSKTGLEPARVLAAATELELGGFAKACAGQCYVLI
ncbi:MAG: DNA-processing protein DprA [Oscillospiraceae bacterium]|jgi:DNA processing protein|nr:DNA-processing protein DprA [Oscillospiraceae bacterium]